MSPRVKIAVSAGVGGWCYVHLDDPSFRLYVRVEAFESPVISEEIRARSFDIPEYLKIVELHVDGDGHFLDADYLRKIPLSAIESIINSGDIRDHLLADLDSQGYVTLNLAQALSHFQSKARNKSRIGKKIEPPLKDAQQVRRPSISRPKKLDDEFLSRVANFYLIAISLNERPIKELSEAAQVPRETAARWIKLARTRGFLASSKIKGEEE